jgi:Ser/Thr protein kinase RdoA (MazF antagonist)
MSEKMTATLKQDIQKETARLLPSYGFSKETTISWLAESENQVFLIKDPAKSESYVARVNSGRLVYHTQQMIESEMAWLQALEKHPNIKVPVVLANNQGKTVHQLHIASSENTRFVSLYSFLPGTEMPEDDLHSVFQTLGKVTSALNDHSKTWTAPEGFQRPEWTVRSILEDENEWGRWEKGVNVKKDTLKLLKNVEATIYRRSEQFPTDHANFGLIHADLRTTNVLVDGVNLAIIDFDDSGFGWYIFELASALSFMEERPDVPDLVNRWLAGYREHGSIVEDLIEEFPTFMMLRRLQLLGWVGYQQQHLEFARKVGKQFTIDTCKLATNYLTRFS